MVVLYLLGRSNQLVYIPAFILPIILPVALHINYYLINRGDVLTIDRTAKIINLKKGKSIYKYNFSDISFINYYFNIYYSNDTGRPLRSKQPPLSEYSYVKIKFKDGTYFYLTSLLVDVAYFKLGIPYVLKYRRVPFITKRETSFAKMRTQVKRAQQEKLALFKGNFGDHSYAELQQELRNNKELKRLEIEAIKELLREKI